MKKARADTEFAVQVALENNDGLKALESSVSAQAIRIQNCISSILNYNFSHTMYINDLGMRMRFQKFGNYSPLSFCSLALPLILLMQISLPGVALCLGLDGHVELESYTEGLCNEINSVTESQKSAGSILRSSTNSPAQHCGTCIDIPTADKNSEHKAVSSNDLMSDIDIHAFAAYQLTPELSPEIKKQSFILEDFPVYKSFLDSIRITVINC